MLGLAAVAQSQTFTVLYSFTGGSDGGNPLAGVVQDPTGNLYGTTDYGGDLNNSCPAGCGVVYKLDAAGAETVLHTFTGSPSDAANSFAPVARDNASSLYGTTIFGGSSGYGAVFKIDAAGNETVLYSFRALSDGCSPQQGLVVGTSRALYGTTPGCGSSGYGTLFKVDGATNFSLLHTFAGADGAYPNGGHLTMDKSGNLYGLTFGGGASSKGALYELRANGMYTVLHSFSGGTTDGCWASGSVLQDKEGNLYGTTNQCGSYNYGTVWKVSKTGKETILHSFAGGTSDGCYPDGGVARDARGNLYGVRECGAHGYGALYTLSAGGKLTLLHSFDGFDGVQSVGEVLRTSKGVLFGITLQGGMEGCSIVGYVGCGTVWSYMP
jgi:uncharacterized repeat protein (TIGR03803 family)